ncbi:MAG: UbiD family decarboxylase, partial [Planctomycetaceae bacterium]|nr:UbiD family decarboxylase [Planctomycetaceae bacterium]
RRVFLNSGPAVLFSNVTGCQFPMVSNLFGTIERARFMFRDTIESVRRAIELKIDPSQALQKPTRYWKAPLTALSMRPKMVGRGAVSAERTTVSELPQLISWPMDAGGFVTLPQVYSEDVSQPGLKHSNLGMYRVQLTGNQYADNQVGLHYQIHRSIGVHHKRARDLGKPFRVNVFVGGAPAMTLAAVMPLPEG